MGQFSWLDCITEEQIVDNKRRDVYVLVPKEFGGGHIKEECYDGYGRFGGHDIYDLVADWNREYISNHPEYVTPHCKTKISEKAYYEAYADRSNSPQQIVDKTKEKTGINWFEYRIIGIDLACYDEDNAALPYPIKITHNPNAGYENCNPSLSDPNQGWEMSDDEDEDDWDWY